MPKSRTRPRSVSPVPNAASSRQTSTTSMCPMVGFPQLHKATYASLISVAIHSSPKQRLMLTEIYEFVGAHRMLVPTASQPNWKNSIRHNLSLRPCFKKVPRWTADGKKLSAYWVLDHKSLPSAAKVMVAQIDAMENIVFPSRFLCGDGTDSALNTTTDPRSPVPVYTRSQLTPEGTDEDSESSALSDGDEVRTRAASGASMLEAQSPASAGKYVAVRHNMTPPSTYGYFADGMSRSLLACHGGAGSSPQMPMSPPITPTRRSPVAMMSSAAAQGCTFAHTSQAPAAKRMCPFGFSASAEAKRDVPSSSGSGGMDLLLLAAAATAEIEAPKR